MASSSSAQPAVSEDSCDSERSYVTRSSCRSRSSYASRAKAKAEAAKVRLAYLEEKARLMKEQAILRIELDMLQERKKCAEAAAEANSYDASS